MLAIVIPYYKLTFFKETLNSLANQTNKQFKVYIGDDGSTEDCKDLLSFYNQQFDFIYHRFENNLGSISLTQQWDRCIALCKDEKWLMILGDDDILGNNVVDEFYKQYHLFKDKSNIVRYSSIIIDNNSIEKSKKFEHKIWENAYDSYFRKFEWLTRSSLSEHIFLRSKYDKYGFADYPLAWFSDDNAWLEFSEGKEIFSINEATVFIRNSELNISGRNDNHVLKAQAKIAFYKNIIDKRLFFFSKEKRLRILYEYETTLRDQNNLFLKEWITMLIKYLVNYDSYTLKKYLKRSLKKLFKL